MAEKLHVALIFGGKSAEHEVSIESAKNVFHALNRNKYEPTLIFIDHQGSWHGVGEEVFEDKAKLPTASADSNSLRTDLLAGVNVVFPVLHGPFGEDGTIQGLLKLMNIPFVGAGVLGSAVAMDKDIAKRLMKEAGLPIGKFLVFTNNNELDYAAISEELGSPFFLKPANLGSSVGISKVGDEKDFEAAVKEAFRFDSKVIAEEFIAGREIECSVLGNADPAASVSGEIIPHADFYSYEAKYIDQDGAELIIPAALEAAKTEEIQNLAKKVFTVLGCSGMARVDFFLRDDGQIFVNEINTIPGFTSISMYPKLWEASGISYSELIDRLITLAIERFAAEQKLKTNYAA